MSAAEKGYNVIIAGAGGAAHLPGIIAAYTTLPVIGVPIKTSTLSGVDSLYSIVQMPKGIPVATVAINGSANAALLAVEIMAVGDKALQKRLIAYRHKMSADVLEKDRKLKENGINKYLELKEASK
jgi:5-(carboxyamino)imidazole ribonucleotide mutase